MLGADDPLVRVPRKILVAGVTGAGKTTLARRIAASRGIPHTEIDALFHGPNWEPRPTFLADIDAATAGDGWITEWQYHTARPMLLERADTLVWLDHPVPLSLARVTRRTIRRSRSREVLWNGNVEPPLRSIFVDPDNILRWALATQFKLRASVPAAEREHPHLQIVRLSGQRQVERWMSGPLATTD
jgi:adenylate kinase family enzyme